MADIGRIGTALQQHLELHLQRCISTCGFNSIDFHALPSAQLSSAQLSTSLQKGACIGACISAFSASSAYSIKVESQLIARPSPIGTTTARQKG